MSGAGRGKYFDENGVARFAEGGTAPIAGNGKSWFNGIVTHRLLDGRGSTSAKNRCEHEVFCLESEVVSMLLKRSPSPWIGSEGEIKTNVFFKKILHMK